MSLDPSREFQRLPDPCSVFTPEHSTQNTLLRKIDQTCLAQGVVQARTCTGLHIVERLLKCLNVMVRVTPVLANIAA